MKNTNLATIGTINFSGDYAENRALDANEITLTISKSNYKTVKAEEVTPRRSTTKVAQTGVECTLG